MAEGKLKKFELKQREIEKLKRRIYQSYDSLLVGGKQERITFPLFLDTGKFVCWSGDIEIEDKIHPGRNYFLGQVVSREKLNNGDYSGLVVRTENGIELFEHYSNRGFRPILVIPENKGLIANISVLERRANSPELEGRTPEEIVRTNFDSFLVLMDKLANSSKEEYQAFYLGLYSEKTLFY